MDGTGFRLRKANIEDCDQVFEWQSLPETRKYSRNPSPPAYKKHVEWMKETLGRPSSYFYIIEYNGVSAGFVRLDNYQREGKCKEVSIMLSPDYQGKGLASMALEAVREAHRDEELVAYIKPENLTSINLFMKCGYYPEENGIYVNYP